MVFSTLLRPWLLPLALIALLPTSGLAERWATIADRVFFNYSVDQGLPTGRVSGIEQDALGFVWLVTQEALIRWDGHVFEHLQTGLADVDTDIRVLRADHRGLLWLGTGQGLRRFDPLTREIQVIELGARFAVMDLDFDRSDGGSTIWLGSEQGVFEIDTRAGTVDGHLQELVARDRTLRVFAVLCAADGSVWAGTSIGMFRNPPDRSGFKRVELEPLMASDTRIADLIQTGAGEIWVGTPRNGAFVVQADGRLRAVDIPDFAQEWIFTLAEIRPGVIWLGTYGRGVIEVDSNTGAIARMQHNPLQGNSIAQDEVWTIATDRSGLVWVGQGRGMSLHDPQQTALLTLFGGVGRSDGLRDAEVKSVIEASDGRVYVGLVESGVDVIDPDSGRIDTIDVDGDRPASALPGGAIEALGESGTGNLYIGSNWGLYRHATGGPLRLPMGARGDNVFTGSLLFAGDYLWAGGTDGLWRVNLDDTATTATLVEVSVSPAFSDPRISTMAQAPDGSLVVGTWNGVNWIDLDGRLIDRIPAAGEQSSPFSNGYITSILFDARGRTWLGTSGGGIYIRDPGRPDLQRLSRAQGLGSEVIGSMQQDAQGRVWVSGNSGLTVIDVDTLAATPLGPADGAMVAPYFRQPGTTTRSGELLFGGDRGLTVVRPERYRRRDGRVPLAFVSARVGGQDTLTGVAGRTPNNALVVPAERNAISTEFAALAFLDPMSISYRYRLLGYEENWQATDAEHRSAAYTALPPGRYQLQVEASNRLGDWGGSPQVLHIRVLPHWYETGWARALIVILIVAASLVILRWRTAQLRTRQRLLEGLIQERTHELEASSQALREKSEALETASMTDPLTGLHNRRFLEKYIPADQALGIRRYRDNAAGGEEIESADLLFFLVDIDHFKQVNDRHGHAAGDAVLRAMRERLQRVFRETDYLVRWGGEEFLVVARGTSRRHAPHVAERIRSQVEGTPFEVDDGVSLGKTCSIGFTAFPFDTRRPEALDWAACVRLADHALYVAKRAGRNAWVGIQARSRLVAGALMQELNQEPSRILSDGWVGLQSNLDNDRLVEKWDATAADRPSSVD